MKNGKWEMENKLYQPRILKDCGSTLSTPDGFYDALLLVSFGGPEGVEDVVPFLENVLRGRNVPRERMLAVAEHYYLFGGVSPINAQNRKLIQTLKTNLDLNGPRLPIYWGNRNWHPLLRNTVQQMADDGIKHALAFVTAAYSSYSSCRQYLENIQSAREAVGPGAPIIEKIRSYFNHPLFIRANSDQLIQALAQIPESRRSDAQVVFTAHSIPVAMGQNSKYQTQLLETARLVAAAAGHRKWTLAYQSRSGSPAQPWLEPDILECIKSLRSAGERDLVIAPIGFVSDHMEIIYDLDVQAKNLCEELGLNFVRASTAGTDPGFVEMIRELILERFNAAPERSFLGDLGPSSDQCAFDCCQRGI
jgi:ferrochelatase